MRVIHTRLLSWAWGMALTPNLVLIRPERRGDEALLAHERQHCEQMRIEGTVCWYWRYATDRTHRQRYEVEAYRVSLKHRPDWLDRYALALATQYRLKLTAEEARTLLTA